MLACGECAEVPPRREGGERTRQFGRGGTLSIATLLALSFGLLVVLAVAAVLLIGFSASRTNTLGLLNEKSMMIVGLIETGVRNHLDPALHQARFIERQDDVIDLVREQLSWQLVVRDLPQAV